MKSLQIGYYSGKHGEGDVYYVDGVLVDFIHSNDAVWRHEYFNGILECVGVKVEKLKVTEEQVTEDIHNKFGW